MSQIMLDEQKATQVLDDLLDAAFKSRASDVHLEPRDRHLRVRFRVDGTLVEQTPVVKAMGPALVSRVKVLANLDVAEKRVPQDGGFSHQIGTTRARFRVSTLPTDYGEKIVLRVLSQRGMVLELGRLGMGEQTVAILQRTLQQPNGCILVTGPTGSGKTSTLYAMLRELDAKSRNVVTLEDPIEIRFPDIVQTNIQPKSGYTFAVGLRAVLRQDPDVVFIGEMRDQETADTALKAGLTGHLVLSSLHTNSAIDTFLRLIDMGLDRFVVAGSVRTVVSQRLVRLLCTQCRTSVVPDPETRATLKLDDPHHVIYQHRGCPKCSETGYQGRTAIFEVIEVDDELADLVKSERSSRADYKDFLARRRIASLRQAGLALVVSGVTSLKEVLRLT